VLGKDGAELALFRSGATAGKLPEPASAFLAASVPASDAIHVSCSLNLGDWTPSNSCGLESEPG
jgi:hypothetical protein